MHICSAYVDRCTPYACRHSRLEASGLPVNLQVAEGFLGLPLPRLVQPAHLRLVHHLPLLLEALEEHQAHPHLEHQARLHSEHQARRHLVPPAHLRLVRLLPPLSEALAGPQARPHLVPLQAHPPCSEDNPAPPPSLGVNPHRPCLAEPVHPPPHPPPRFSPSLGSSSSSSSSHRVMPWPSLVSNNSSSSSSSS
jgi:hypothetical protein